MGKNRGPVAPIESSEVHLAAHLFTSARLTLARELRGLTKAELAERVGKTPSAVSQFEADRARPDPQTLAALALALGVPIGFFVQPERAPMLGIDDCHFRSLRSASQRARRALLARGTLLSELLAVLEEVVELPAEHVSAVAEPINSIEEIEACAVRVRKTWGLGLGPIPNVVRLLESKGVLASWIPEGCREVDAFSGWYGGRPLVFLVTEKQYTSRTRFDAAHELGHLVMHADVAPGDPDREREANRFAGAFLVPREPFLEECPRHLNWNHFYELKRRWRVSVAALVRRAHDLGMLSQASYRRAFVELNRRGERFQEPDEPPAELPTLVDRALAEAAGLYPTEDLSNRLGLTQNDLTGLLDGTSSW